MDGFTVFLIVLGALTLSCAFMWVILRVDAWLDGRPW